MTKITDIDIGIRDARDGNKKVLSDGALRAGEDFLKLVERLGALTDGGYIKGSVVEEAVELVRMCEVGDECDVIIRCLEFYLPLIDERYRDYGYEVVDLWAYLSWAYLAKKMYPELSAALCRTAFLVEKVYPESSALNQKVRERYALVLEKIGKPRDAIEQWKMVHDWTQKYQMSQPARYREFAARNIKAIEEKIKNDHLQ